jgi:IclR family KDG regulon transcriptional repressor
VYRILTTLEGRGYLDRAADGSYRMAKKLFDLQRTESVEQILNRIAQPIMERVVEATKETVNLGILDAGEVVVINTVESPQAVRMSSKIGNRRHLHSTALGKIFLAGLPEKEFLRLIRMKGLPRLTDQTLTGKPAVIEEINRVRKQGWAMDNQENEIEGRCIGAPILTPDGRVVAALSISGPVFRMDVARAKSLVPQLKAFCVEISERLAALR